MLIKPPPAPGTGAPRTAAPMRWLDELRFVYGKRILPGDDAGAATWGKLMAQRADGQCVDRCDGTGAQQGSW